MRRILVICLIGLFSTSAFSKELVECRIAYQNERAVGDFVSSSLRTITFLVRADQSKSVAIDWKKIIPQLKNERTREVPESLKLLFREVTGLLNTNKQLKQNRDTNLLGSRG